MTDQSSVVAKGMSKLGRDPIQHFFTDCGNFLSYAISGND
jgi:hypothetical protein